MPFLYYTRSTFPDFRARAETYTRFGFPFTKIRTFCKLAPHLRRLAFSAWDRALPKEAFLPVTMHLRAIYVPSLLKTVIQYENELLKILKYFTIYYTIMQQLEKVLDILFPFTFILLRDSLSFKMRIVIVK